MPHLSWIVAMLGLYVLISKHSFRKKYKLMYKQNVIIFLCLIFCIVLSFFTIFINQTNDFSYINFILGIILCVFRNYFLLWVFDWCFKDNANLSTFITYFLYSCIVYISFTIAFIIMPSFKDFWLQTVIVSVKSVDYISYTYRYSLNGFAAFASSVVFCLAFVLNGYALTNDGKFGTNKKYILTFILLLTGAFFYGRTCFIGLLLGVILMIYNLKRSLYQTLKVFLSAFIIIVLLSSILRFVMTINDALNAWGEWAFSIITQIFVDRKITDHSVTHMFKDMFFMPKINTFLIGDGLFTDPLTKLYYMNTDVGYMRSLLFFGITGCLSYMYIFYTQMKNVIHSKNNPFKSLYLVVIVLIAILELKGQAFHIIMFCFLPIIYIINSKKGEEKRNE